MARGDELSPPLQQHQHSTNSSNCTGAFLLLH